MSKEKTKKLINEVKALSSYEEKLAFLKNKFAGETCYILGCGPSLRDVDKEKLIEEVKEHTLFTIKQSLFGFREHVDFQFFNDNNFIAYPDMENALYIANSGWNSESITRAYYWKNQQIDICTRIIGTIHKGSVQQLPMSKLQHEDDFKLSEYTIEKTGLMRTWGAGIMYELVLFFAYHLGFSEIRTVGWDYNDPNSKEHALHFYSEEARLKTINPCNPAYSDEMLDSINLAEKYSAWFKSQNIKLTAHESDNCFLPDNIERFKI